VIDDDSAHGSEPFADGAEPATPPNARAPAFPQWAF